MTHLPNPAQGNMADFGNEGHPPQMARTSAMAITAFVLACLGFCIPGISVLAVLFGVIAIILIGASNGKVKGNVFAILSVVFGGIVIAIYAIAFYAMSNMVGMLTQPFQSFEASLTANTPAALRTQLDPSVASTLTDEQLNDFLQAFNTETGGITKAPDGVISMVKLYIANAETLSASQNQFNNMLPWPVETQNGHAIIIFDFDENAFTQGTFSSRNITIITDDGTEINLIP